MTRATALSRRIRHTARSVATRTNGALARRRSLRRASEALAAATPLMTRGRSRSAVLLAHDAAPAEVSAWLRLLRDHDLHVLFGKPDRRWTESGVPYRHHRARSLHQAQPALERIGPLALVVDLDSRTVEQLDRTWHALAFHLEERGLYLRPSAAIGPVGELRSWIARLAAEPEADPGAIVLTDEALVVVKRHRHYLKLREEDTEQILPSREPALGVRELAALSGGEFSSRAEIISHESATSIPWLPEQMTYPPMRIRRYEGRIGFLGNMLLHSDTSILADTFRDLPGPHPAHRLLDNVSPRFARIPPALVPAQTLDGSFYQVDAQFGGHFGHVMTELVGRLWGWDEAKRQVPELKAIYRGARRSGREALERRLLRAYGIADDDIVQIDQPVYLHSLVSATTMWHNADPHFAHPALPEVWARLKGNLVDPGAPTSPRIFVSRGDNHPRRQCRNSAEVEEFFAAHGFTVVWPERLDLGTQAALFAAAEVVAGFAGSAMFNLMFATAPKAVILLSHEAYLARNEHLYTSLVGGPVHYFWSSPDVPHPEGDWSRAAMVSSWAFDFARNRAALEDLLERCA